MVCVKGWFVWRDVILRMINGLCEGMVHVNGWFVWWLVWSEGLCEGMVSVVRWFVWRDGLCLVHPFTQTIPSHKPYGLCEGMVHSHKPSLHTYKIICNTENDKWFVGRDGPSCKPSRFTNHPFTQPIYHSLYYIPSHRPSLHTNHLSFSILHIIWFVWRVMMNGLCEGMDCVKGW